MSIPAFPALPGITYPLKRSPSGSSVRHESISGRRTILPLRTVPRWSWDVPIEFLRSKAWRAGSFSEFESLVGFYNSCVMAGAAFSYADPDDNVVTAQPFGSGDGVTTQFQLVRTLGGFTEPVYLPTISQVTVAGTPTGAYTLGSTGVVTFASAPALGAALGWTGTFAWLCRFDDDSIEVGRFMSGLYEAKSIKFSNEIAP